MFARPAWLLRIEAAVLFAASLFAYRHFHFGWWLFGALFLAPDLFMLGYLLNARVGATLYNVGHVVFAPVAVFAFGYGALRPTLMAIGLIWFSHIKFDRMLGYGLKYPTHFKDTHLQRTG